MAQHNIGYGQGHGQRGYQQQAMMPHGSAGMNMASMQGHMSGGTHTAGHPSGAGTGGGGGGPHAGGGHGSMPSGATPQMMSPTKEVNLASLVILGQETVQDIVSKTAEVFKLFTAMQLPNNVTTGMQSYQERRAKLNEAMPMLQVNFRKVRIIYDKINENTAALDAEPAEKLLPVEENGEVKGERTKTSESMKFALEEYKDTCEQVRAKNQQLKEIIDQLRTVIWEINTMMAMRKM